MATQLTWWPSVAKLNLFLHINGRLDNGYHQLQTVFQLLDYGDEMAFDINQSQQINLKDSIKGVPDEDNLIVKAARLLNPYATSYGADIYLKKRLPMGGGIGGGSSNAATTLLALNKLWHCNLDTDTLAEIGLSLGADVPVFVRGLSSFASGVGEKISPIQLPQRYFLVVHPNVHVSTADIFAADELPRNTPPIEINGYTFDSTHNDCQKIVCQRHPQVANLLQWLIEYAPSRMTGTGACLFAVFEHADKAHEVLKQLPEHCMGFVAKGVARSPLLDML